MTVWSFGFVPAQFAVDLKGSCLSVGLVPLRLAVLPLTLYAVLKLSGTWKVQKRAI